ncbi:MAG: rane protein [Candidatus Saccharibacteria bacterium]|jgi:LemA protein|nr:rane protein [Candidatus Saccharibacteria bacterium]
MLTVVLIVLAVLALGLIVIYNGLIRARIRVDEAWSDITVQLKRRYDLIPNVVESVKGYAKHEKDTLENVTKARTAAMDATGLQDKAKSENMLTDTLKSLFAVAEQYPDLKANQNFLHLQQELVDTEDKIQASRRFYNGGVRDYNSKLQVFPTNLIGQMLGFTNRDFFDVDNKAQVEKPVEVKF